MARADHIAWLHRGGRSARWGNLGLWRSDTGEVPPDYAAAAAALARCVGRAAGMGRGGEDETVLSLACGAGEELALWAEEFGAVSAMALEVSPVLAAQARRRAESVHTGCRIEVHCADARHLGKLVGGRFQRIVCVDAAYHLGLRLPLLRAARALLQPGGGFAFSDFVLHQRRGVPFSWQQGWRQAAMQLGAGVAGIAPGEVVGLRAGAERLRAAGFDDVRATPLDEAVLGGFCTFAEAQARRIGLAARWSSGWRRVALTLRLIRLGRRVGLGYAVFSGRAAPLPAAPYEVEALDSVAAERPDAAASASTGRK